MPQPATDGSTQSSRGWLRGVGVVWLVLFSLWFYRFDLPNGRLSDGTPVSRGDVWIGLTDVLLENIFPTPDPNAPPSGWQYLPQRVDILGVAAFILAGAWGLGHLTLRALSLRERFDAPSRTMFAFGLGLSGLSLLTLGCGLMGLLSRVLFATSILLIIAAEAACRFRSRSKTARRKTTPWSQRQWDILPILCVVVVTPFLLAMLFGAMLPSTDFDVKEYHLEGPKEYFLQGHVAFLSHNVYTSFPFLTEMLSLLGMVLRDDWYRGALVGKVVLMSFAPLTALGLFAAGRRWFSPTVGWLCVLAYLTTPWVYRISVIAYAEGGLTFYLFATLLAVLWLTVDRSQRKPEEREAGTADSVPSHRYPAPSPQSSVLSPQHSSLITHHSSNFLLLCGLLAGSAVACKYPGVLSVAIPLGGFLLSAALCQPTRTHSDRPPKSESMTTGRNRVRRVCITASWFTLGTLITFGPWLAKNIIETGNPVYPLLYSVFGGADWDAASHAKWQAGHPPAIIGLLKDVSSLPGNLAQRVIDVIARSDWQSPLLFGAAPLAFLWTRRRRLVGGLWIYVGWLFLTWWALTHHIDRFWVPMLPVVTLLAGAGLAAILGETVDRAPRNSRLSLGIAGLTSLLIAAAALFNIAFVSTRLCGYNAYLIDLDAARQETMTPGIALLQEQLPADARVLFVGEAQVFDAEFDYVYNTVFDESLFERWTSADQPGVPAVEQPTRSAEDIRATLREQGITHLFVNWSEVLRYRQTYGYTDYVSPDRVRELVQAEVLTPVALNPQRTLRMWDSLDDSTQAEVVEWGPSLRVDVAGIDAFWQYELFEVR